MGLAMKATLFVSSYAPMLLLFGVLDTFGIEPLRWALIVLGAASLGLLPIMFFVAKKNGNPRTLQLTEAKPKDIEMLAFFASYVVPFTTVAPGNATRTWGLIVFLVLTAGIYLRNGLYYLNPIIALLGFKVFDVKIEGGTSALMITRRKYVEQTQAIAVVRLEQRLYLDVSGTGKQD